jgi:hypothetical protein
MRGLWLVNDWSQRINVDGCVLLHPLTLMSISVYFCVPKDEARNRNKTTTNQETRETTPNQTTKLTISVHKNGGSLPRISLTTYVLYNEEQLVSFWLCFITINTSTLPLVSIPLYFRVLQPMQSVPAHKDIARAHHKHDTTQHDMTRIHSIT